MPQSIVKIYVHLIFSTKKRCAFIQPEWKDRLYNYIAGILNERHSPALRIGGTTDHIHILFCCSKTRSLTSIIEDVKRSSSRWASENYLNLFAWQSGYAAFSVSYSVLGQVCQYISNQEKHHAKKDFSKEMKELMQLSDMKDYNEFYFME